MVWYSTYQIDHDYDNDHGHDDLKVHEDILIEHGCDTVLHEGVSRKGYFHRGRAVPTDTGGRSVPEDAGSRIEQQRQLGEAPHVLRTRSGGVELPHEFPGRVRVHLQHCWAAQPRRWIILG